MESVYKQLNMSVHALVSQLELLKKQVLKYWLNLCSSQHFCFLKKVSSKEKQIGDLQTEQRQIWQLYQLNNDKIKEEEAIKQDREQVLSDLQNELQASQERIEELEQTLTNDQELRKKDLDYQQAMMTDLVNQLQQLTGNEEDVSGVRDTCTIYVQKYMYMYSHCKDSIPHAYMYMHMYNICFVSFIKCLH